MLNSWFALWWANAVTCSCSTRVAAAALRGRGKGGRHTRLRGRLCAALRPARRRPPPQQQNVETAINPTSLHGLGKGALGCRVSDVGAPSRQLGNRGATFALWPLALLFPGGFECCLEPPRVHADRCQPLPWRLPRRPQHDCHNAFRGGLREDSAQRRVCSVLEAES